MQDLASLRHRHSVGALVERLTPRRSELTFLTTSHTVQQDFTLKRRKETKDWIQDQATTKLAPCSRIHLVPMTPRGVRFSKHGCWTTASCRSSSQEHCHPFMPYICSHQRFS